MKKILILIITAALIFGSVSILAACGEEQGCAHVWGEWNIEDEADCEHGGKKSRICDLCGKIDRINTPAASHTYSEEWSFDANYHWRESTCIHAGEKSQRQLHTYSSGVCTVCGHFRATQDMSFHPLVDRQAYIISGIGTSLARNVILGRTYYNYPVIGVGERALYNAEGILSIVVQDNIEFIEAEAFADISTLKTVEIYKGLDRIDSRAFGGLTALESITFHGTLAEWEAIEKATDWDEGSATYQLICTEEA